ELEAFAQFGSDLDASTQAKLNRGERTVEVLKQGLHEPLVVEKQVMILYALVQGFLDDIIVNDVVRFELVFYTYIFIKIQYKYNKYKNNTIKKQKKKENKNKKLKKDFLDN